MCRRKTEHSNRKNICEMFIKDWNTGRPSHEDKCVCVIILRLESKWQSRDSVNYIERVYSKECNVLNEKHGFRACDINYSAEISGTEYRTSQREMIQAYIHNKNDAYSCMLCFFYGMSYQVDETSHNVFLLYFSSHTEKKY